MDPVSPTKFDNSYYKNLIAKNGLLSSDEILTQNQQTMEFVKRYAENQKLFFQQFAKSMIKIGNINPLTGESGQIRNTCRKVNI